MMNWEFTCSCSSPEILMGVKKAVSVFWIIMLCGFVGRCQRFGETSCLRLQGCSSETLVFAYKST
jgi:hypothetical protein